ncbi:MAG: PilZ domain-containing protein [Myxococcota bacterium]
MHAAPHDGSAHHRRVALLLNERSVTPRVLEALRALGYVLIDDDATEQEDERARAGVWLVDEDRLESLPNDPDEDLRVLAIVSPAHTRPVDPRVFAQTARPGRLGSVYGMIQRALESTPRRCPRVPTRLSARCIRADRRSIGAVLSLSEGGCLLRTGEALRKGAKLDLQFALPDYGLVSTRAECRYVRRGDAGLAFEEANPDVRHTIAHYVTCQLARDGVLATAR